MRAETLEQRRHGGEDEADNRRAPVQGDAGDAPRRNAAARDKRVFACAQ